MTIEHIHQALRVSGAFETLESTPMPNQLRLLGRVHNDSMGDWLECMTHIYLGMVPQNWKVDISKLYLIRNGKLAFVWRMVFRADNLEAEMQSILTTISSLNRPRGEVTEIRLPGATANRNAYKNGKGAALFGQERVGPRSTTEET